MTLTLAPIGFVQTPFLEKVGVPRQTGLVPEAKGIIKLNPEPEFKDALRYLDTFSHIWVIFQFHQNSGEPWRKLTTTPRVGAPERVGTFASRSPHRPNGLGISALKLDFINFDAKGGIEIYVSGVDLLDGTPVFDIKPYVPYVDSIPEATGSFTEFEIPKYRVTFSEEVLAKLGSASHVSANSNTKLLIAQMLELDPRPTPQKKSYPIDDPKSEGLSFAFRVGKIDVKWEIRKQAIYVSEITV